MESFEILQIARFRDAAATRSPAATLKHMPIFQKLGKIAVNVIKI